MKTQGEENTAYDLQHGVGGKLKEKLHQIEIYQLSLDIYRGPGGPLQSH